MDPSAAILALAALAQPTRLDVYRLLVRHEPDGLAAGDLARELAVPHNTLSSHLSILTRADLVTSRRHGRSIVYRAKLPTLQAVTLFLLQDCCGGNPRLCASLIESIKPCCQPNDNQVLEEEPMETSDRVFNVLFLCTGNTARSIIAESILRKEGRGRFRAFSAGSQPKGEVNPYALRVLERAEYPTGELRSKSWLEYASPDAPVMDFVFTVCDNAAGETCPVWPGQPMTAHWGIEDPAAVEGTDLDKEAAFVKAQRYLKNRIVAFCNLPLASIDRLALGTKLRDIGRMEGATVMHDKAS